MGNSCACTRQLKKRTDATLDDTIQRSKRHWSQVVDYSDSDDEEDAEASNVEVFKALQMHTTWGGFFYTFGDGPGVRESSGELVVGPKFAEGGQAELFEAQVQWWDPEIDEWYLKDGTQWVLKVFKKGTLLRHLQSQWPHGYLQCYKEEVERTKLGAAQPVRHYCAVFSGTLLKDGRFAFLMVREQEDLRSHIDRRMESIAGHHRGPFRKEEEEAELIMYRIALGMDWLHSRNIVHRDLKASNVLMQEIDGQWACFVADFECSIGVVGTGFFRAPEILQACKDNNVSRSQELFTKEVDVYSFGMTCYEILTGKLPFEGHPWMAYDLILDGKRPKVPKYVDDWARGLLKWCWQSNPADRPSFGDILNLLSANSAIVRAYQLHLMELVRERNS